MKATLTNFKQPATKVRIVAKALAGKKVSVALRNLRFINKKSSHPLAKLIVSASHNAGDKNPEVSEKIIKKITVHQGRVMKRFMPRARGSAGKILKRSCTINIELQ